MASQALSALEPRPRLLDIFLCHAQEDKPKVRTLYKKLRGEGFRPWLDEKDMLGGTRWEDAIQDAVRKSDAVLVCLSSTSIKKEGYVQKELKFVLGVADEKPDGAIFQVPVRLDNCEVPRVLKDRQRIDYFKKGGYAKLVRTLEERARQVGAQVLPPVNPSQRQIRNLQEERPSSEFEKADEAAQFILKKTNLRPQIALILGSGLGAYADDFGKSVVVNYGDIPHFSTPTTIGHAGRLVIGEKNGTAVAAMQGRFHLYEGLRLEQVVFPVRVLARMGVRAAILTSAAGLLNPEFPIGSIVVLSDHINLLGPNPLIGPNDEAFGPRFPDMGEVYSKHYRYLAHLTADELGVPLREGVYAVHSGPAYETPAEIRSMRNLGADLVGMSTVPEAIAARHAGLHVLAICIATSYGAGMPTIAISHSDVLEAGEQFRKSLIALLDGIIPKIAGDLGCDSRKSRIV